MWEQDWARLGIAPTTELGAIKKAYALKLKVTRPDDDADAYQALRGAYERAQQWVKWQLQDLAEAIEGETPELAEPAPAVAAEAAPELPRAPTPAELVAAMERHRVDGGAAALAQALPLLLLALHEVPVGMEEATSQAFATWVLQRPDVPLDVLAALNAHFGWRGDYRAERALGAELAFALHAALDERMPVPITDPEMIAQAAPLLGFERLRQRRLGGALAPLFGTLSLHSLQRLRAAFGDRLLRGLGLSVSRQTWMDNTLMLATGLRWLLPTALLACATYVMLDDGENALRLVCLSLAATMGFRMLMKGMGLVLRWEQPTQQNPRFAGLAQWRSRQRSAWTGVGIVTAGAVFAEVVGHWMPTWLAATLGILVVALGILTIRWGRSLEHSRALAGCLVASALALRSILGPQLLVSTWIAVGVLWVLLGWVVYEGRSARLSSSPAAWFVRPLTNTLALCDRWGWGFASWPLLLIGAMSLTVDRAGSLLLTWGIWSVAAFLLFIGQNTVDRVCHRWLARQVGVER